MNPPQRPGPHPEVLPPRPQVGIERLPARHLATEPRESMNCKSCRKRKIKCNRLRPSCEACQVFQCPCIYDAVPKKRGPKTDVLEALLKRVDGLEAKLKEKNTELEQATQSQSAMASTQLGFARPSSSVSVPAPEPALAPAPTPASAPASTVASAGTSSSSTSTGPLARPSIGASTAASTSPSPSALTTGSGSGSGSGSGPGSGSSVRQRELDMAEPAAKRLAFDGGASPGPRELSVYPPQTPTSGEPGNISHAPVEVLLNAYFNNFHCKPYYILDETPIRNRAHSNQLPQYLFDALAAVALRRVPHPDGDQAVDKLCREYAHRARSAVDADDPSMDALQTLILLILAFTSEGRVKKAFMLLSNAVGMAVALEMHRELPPHIRTLPGERESRRRIFWTCYILDRFLATGSRRPSLISDGIISLRLPSWAPTPSSLPIDGEFFLCGPNQRDIPGAGKRSQGATGMLIDIVRLLGVTDKYLAAGGVKGDSHFPWHSLSTLSKIRADLDHWASGNGNMFSSLDATFGQADSSQLTLSKLIYHCIHCLIYRAFLPISLSELAGNGHQESWQIEATNLCFFHANSITELVQAAKQSGAIQLTPSVGYSLCTAGTAHIHGAYYGKQEGSGEMSITDASTDLLAQEMELLSGMQRTWTIVRKQQDMLQRLYEAHGELVGRTMSGSMMRYALGFQLEDFFDRYSNIGGPGGISYHFDSANLSFFSETGDGAFNEPTPAGEVQIPTPRSDQQARPSLKRKNTSQSPRQQVYEMRPQGNHHIHPPTSQTSQSMAMAAAGYPPSRTSSSVPMPMQVSMMHHGHSSSPPMHAAHMEHPQAQAQAHHHHHHLNTRTPDITPPGNGGASGGYGISNSPNSTPGGMGSVGSVGGMSFGPTYNYHTVTTPNGGGQAMINDGSGGYDAMFGGIPTNAYGSPAGWAGDGFRMMGHAASGAAAPSPSTKSNSGSIGTAGDEKDPFMCLLEQLANDEQRQQNGLKYELDFYLAGGSNARA